jgi:UDP-N-acetylglucosamine 2-epimerase (non-hydrolysing)
LTVAIVLGTRPEILKNYSIVQALRHAQIKHEIIWTSQHTDTRMHEEFFRLLSYEPDHILDRYTLGRAVDWTTEILKERNVSVLLVNGDTSAAVVGALAAMHLDIPLAHVEAGLRSYDPLMYEERNRLMVDAIAEYLFTYTRREADYLKTRPEYRGSIYEVGNTSVDLIHAFKSKLRMPCERPFAFATLHRKELTDRPSRIVSALDAFAQLGQTIKLVFAIHPRTLDAMSRAGLLQSSWPTINFIEPVGPLESLSYIKYASVILTDSGCIQEEAAILETPCVTVRENTERHQTIDAGINILSGFDSETILDCAKKQLTRRGSFPNIYGKPGSGRRIVDIILENYDRS